MELICRHEKLNQALSLAARVVPSRSELPILNNLLLRTEEAHLAILATNLQLSLYFQIPAEIKSAGAITAPASALQAYVSSWPRDKVEIKLEGSKLQLKDERAEASFVTMPADDYPTFPQKKEEDLFRFQTETLAYLIKKVKFSTAIEESRPVLTGILVKVKENEVTMVSTDGFRLSEVRGKLKTPSTIERSFIIPVAAFQELEKLFSAGSDEVRFYLTQDENQIIFDLLHLQLATRLLEAEYPDYEKILPQDFQLNAVVSQRELLQALRSVAIFAQHNGQTVYLTFDKDHLTLAAQSAELGSTRIELPAEIKGGPLKMAFNVNFLREGVEAIDGEELKLEAKDPLAPIKLSAPEQKDYFHIIMPIRMEESEA